MPINFKNIKTTGNREYDEGLIAQINDSLQDIPIKQRAAILGSIIEESGGNPLPRSERNTYQGLLQWGHDRYNILPMATEESELSRQLEYIKNTIHNTKDGKSWTHGGTGSGYDTGVEAHEDFNSETLPLDPSFRGFSYGYVRPKGKEKSYKNRLKVAQQVYDRLYEEEKKKPVATTNWESLQYQPPIKFEDGGTLTTHKTWDDLSMTEKAAMMKVAVRNGITSLNEIKAHYNEFAEGGNLYGGGSYLDKAKAMIRANEGWRSTPYKDAPKGKNWRSVGYGFNDSGFWEKYPDGISKHYKKGITKAQAEQELTYYLGKAERQLRGIYGKRWDSFNDDQKAAILDTYYQSPASVGSKSGFYSAVMAGRDGAPYLGVRGFGDRNQSRRDLYRGRGVSAPMTFDTISESASAEPEMISFKPLNPQAFDNPMFTYTPPTLMEEPIQVNSLAEAYNPEELERQEKRDNLERFNMFMNMLSSPSGEDTTGLTGMLGAMNMLSGNKKAEGGNLFDGDTEPTQQMQQGYIRQRPEGTYFYDVQGQPEIDVTPLNTSLSSNPADWSFTDASGKIYSPHRDAVQGTGELREGNQEGPILSAVNNYLRELNWRAKNDPASIALQGKYTMPAIAATALLPWLGEAAAATNVAGVPLMTWADAGLTAGFAGHGLNHAINEGVDGWGDAAMTALEIAPLGRLAKPMLNEAAFAVENYRYPFGRPQVPKGFGSTSTFTFGDLGDKAGQYIHVGTPKNNVWISKDKTWPELSELGENSRGVPIYQIDAKAYDAKFGEPTLVDYEGNSIGIPISEGSWEEPASVFKGFPQAIISKEQLMQVPYVKTTRNPITGLWERELYQPEKIAFAEETPVAEWPINRAAPQITAENAASYAPKVNWDADNWFKTISGRSSYSAEEAAELASHVPEYRAIEQRLFDEGKLTIDSKGDIIVNGSDMSPQEYIMRQSEAFQKMNPEHHYVGVSKKLRDTFENEARDPATRNRYDVWTDRKSPKNVEEYAISQQGGSTFDSNIEYIKNRMTIREENYELHKEQLKWKLEHGKISQEQYDRDLAALKDNYDLKRQTDKAELYRLEQQRSQDPLDGGKVFDVTYPKEATETPIINAENSHWTSIPFDNVVRDAPNVVNHYTQRPYNDVMQTDQIISAARRNGYDVTHIDNVMDTYDGTMLNETIIGRNTPVKSVLGNTGTFDIKGANKWKLYRSLLPPFLGLGAAGTLYGKQE